LLCLLGDAPGRQEVAKRELHDVTLKSHFDGTGHSGVYQLELLGQRPRQAVHRLGTQQSEELLIGEATAQSIDDEAQPGLLS
jgi:hypothetical protein